MKDKESLPWDKKKIVLLLIFLLGALFLLITAKSVFLDNPSEDVEDSRRVRGVKTEESKVNSSSIQFDSGVAPIDIDEKVADIKSQVDSIQISEIATSSPQIQKILNDIKSIKDYPSSTARQACENICKNL